MRVLLAAEESAGIQALRAVAKSECELVAVMTSAPEGTRRGTVVSDVARQLDVPVWPAAYVKDPALGVRMRDEDVDLLLNVHSLHIAHGDVVAAPRIGSFNLHPGPLPQYVGLNAPSWAIVNGEARHAVTLHWMEARLDMGAIAYEDWFDLAESDTGLSVSMQCVGRGIALMRQLLETASRDPSAIPAQVPQAAEEAVGSMDVELERRQFELPVHRLEEFGGHGVDAAHRGAIQMWLRLQRGTQQHHPDRGVLLFDGSFRDRLVPTRHRMDLTAIAKLLEFERVAAADLVAFDRHEVLLAQKRALDGR